MNTGIQKYFLLIIFSFIFFSTGVLASGYRIEVKIVGFEEDELYLAYYYGNNQYIKDTAYAGTEKNFVFTGEEALPAGVYMIVIPPNNNYFEILVDENEQKFSLRTGVEDLGSNVEIFGEAPQNRLFFSYIKFLSEKRKIVEQLQLEKESANQERAAEIDQNLVAIDDEVNARQEKIIYENPSNLVSTIIKAQQNISIPVFEGDEAEVQLKQYYYYREHYFDKTDFTNPGILRTPFLFNKINYFIEKLTVQQPDSLIKSIDYVLSLLNPDGETFKYYLIHFLNKFAKSTYVGWDAVYVHIVLNYYAKGLAPWSDKDELEKIINNGKTLLPLLIGKIAPDFTLEEQSGEEVSLHKFDAKYTVLYFWRESCSKCVEQIPELKRIQEKYAKYGLKVFTVCTAVGNEVKKNREFIEAKNLTSWTNTSDPYKIAQVMKLYDIKSTPQLYLLDKDKKILSKKIAVSQLEEVLDKILNE